MIFIRKIIFIFTLHLIFLGGNTYAEIVKKVEVNGNERISLETIVIYGDISIGNNYESNDINLLIKKLYHTTFFSDIEVELQNGLLLITVAENPIINSIIFKGEKADKYKEAINEKLILKEKTSYIKNFVKTDVDLIRNFYRTLGFYFVKIDVEIENLNKHFLK